MNIRSKAISTAVTFTMAGTLCAIGTTASYAAPTEAEKVAAAAQAATEMQASVGSDEICAVVGIGSGAAGLSKALAKGASWVGIGASIGCYLYTQAKKATPAQKRAAMIKSYKSYQAKSDLKKLEALGYSCRKKSTGGGGGDIAPLNSKSVPISPKVGYRDIKMKGVTYKCSAIGD
ncbi:hypothetical protein [Streptomyces sp. NPDC087294]|uniref:hypothetical protein n=1 Tax=Streptomyces sp. NPDC087294 TaxID=3365777 RepID=UPI0037F84323